MYFPSPTFATALDTSPEAAAPWPRAKFKLSAKFMRFTPPCPAMANKYPSANGVFHSRISASEGKI